MSSIREGITKFLQARQGESPYLIPLWSPDLESQFIVHAGSCGVEGATDTWTDNSEIWFHHRWPYKAGTNPNYSDRKLTFSPGAHLRRFGSTWWNFKTKRSVAVAFDIDLEGEHAQSTTTVTQEQLDDLIEKLGTLPYLTLVRSSGGGGVHIYCFFDEQDQPEAVNHNEHTQVAKSVIAKVSDDLGYDLSKHMDAVGVVFWMWSCDSPEGHPGYELIKEQTERLGAKDLVGYENAGLSTANKKVSMRGFTDSGEEVETFEDGGYKEYELDPFHVEFLKELEDMGYSFRWEAEYKMAHTHTCAIRALIEKREAAGRPLKGRFTTISQGSDKNKPNCYITPRPDGVFQCKRFGTATAESPLWMTRGDDTWCFINTETPVLLVMKKFATTYDGSRMVFEPAALERCLQALGHTLGEGHETLSAPITVTLRKDGVFFAKFKGEGVYPGWKPGKEGFSKDLPVTHKKAEFSRSLLEDADKIVRHVVTPDRAPYGWALKASDGHWIMHSRYDGVSAVVQQAFGKDANSVKSEMTMNPWVLDHLPFGPEYPGKRKWNKMAPQLKYQPAEKPGPHPHWDMVFNHLGKSLDDTVAKTKWCQQWGLQTGADYLLAWVSSMIQEPFQQLPYLFFYGPQNCGKSQFHESVAMLLTCGVESIGSALASGAGYNAEVANAVLGFVEEKDLSTVRDNSYVRIKEWSTARMLQIHQKGHTPYQQRNSLHMCHMSNTHKACPMEDGDTRITAVLVTPIEKLIPKQQFEDKLEAEAPFFLRTLLTMHLPKSHERYRVPMLATEHKRDLESMSQTPFETFCEGFLIPCEGHVVQVKVLHEKFNEYCQDANVEKPKQAFLMQMLRARSDKFLLGKNRQGAFCLGNVTIDSEAKPKDKALKLSNKGRLTSV
jgi:hypothetical protein